MMNKRDIQINVFLIHPQNEKQILCVYLLEMPAPTKNNKQQLFTLIKTLLIIAISKEDVTSINIYTNHKETLFKTRGPRWPCIVHLITRQVSSQLTFLYKRRTSV